MSQKPGFEPKHLGEAFLRLIICLVAGCLFIFCLSRSFPYENRGPGEACSPQRYNLTALFDTNQVDLLTIMLALAAYTSGVVLHFKNQRMAIEEDPHKFKLPHQKTKKCRKLLRELCG